MRSFDIVFSYPGWYLLLCIVIGFLYAFLLYQRNEEWKRGLKLLLAGLRWFVVSLISFLLLAPLVQYTKNDVEQATIVFAIDNSESVPLQHADTTLRKLLDKLVSIRDNLEKKEIRTELYWLKDTTGTSLFSSKTTDLNHLLKTISDRYENRNLDKLILLSDGIHNQGLSPDYQTHPYPIVSWAIGDTLPQKDIKINRLSYNKLAYMGNQFSISAEVQNIGFPDSDLKVYLQASGKVIAQKNIRVPADGLKEISFLIQAQEKGLKRYTLAVQESAEEITYKNNYQDAFIEIIDGREKILLAGLAPHPDITTIKSILETNPNYDVELLILGRGKPKLQKYDLVILHQIPNIFSKGNDWLKTFQSTHTPILYLLGNASNIAYLNQINPLLTIRSGERKDQVSGFVNPNFTAFNLDNEALSIIEKLPPLDVPFGNYEVAEGEVILYQKVKNITTKRPLLAISKNTENKIGIWLGDGLWKWKQELFNRESNTRALDVLFLKVAQYLSLKEDKRKLRVYPVQSEFDQNDPVLFEVEMYNDLYERVYGEKVDIAITDEKGISKPYSFIPENGNAQLKISNFPKGAYSYTANAVISGKKEKDQGQFLVKETALEALNTTANHHLLRRLSAQSGGKVFYMGQEQALENYLIETRKPNLIYSKNTTEEMINLKILLFLIIALISVEWIFRKLNGVF